MWLRNLIWFSILRSFLFFYFFYTAPTAQAQHILLRHPNFEHSSPLYIYIFYLLLFIYYYYYYFRKYILASNDVIYIESTRQAASSSFICLVWRSRVSCVVTALWVALITFLYVFYLLPFIYYYYLGKEFERECNSHWINRLGIWIWSKFIRISRLSIYIDL